MIIKYEHHGTMVSVQDHNQGLHRQHCLCFQGCKFFKPNEPDNCTLAQGLFEYDVKYNMTTPVWECPKFDIKEKEA
jgi:hypothetical protein